MMLCQLSRHTELCRWSTGGPSVGCSSSSTPFSAHKLSSLPESPPDMTEAPHSEAGKEQHVQLKGNSEEGSTEESGHGPDPKLFHGNLGSPGNQPDAPQFVGNCPGSCPL